MKKIFTIFLFTIVLLKVIGKEGEEMKVYLKISQENSKNAFKILAIEKN